MVDSPNRETARDKLAELIETALGSAGLNIIQRVYSYSTTDISNESPVILVFSDGTNRPERQGFGDDSKFTTYFRLRVQVYVAQPGPNDVSYTQQRADDLLDLIDKEIGDVVTENDTVAGIWRSLNYEEGFSRPDDVLMSGSPYTREEFVIVAAAPY